MINPEKSGVYMRHSPKYGWLYAWYRKENNTWGREFDNRADCGRRKARWISMYGHSIEWRECDATEGRVA